MQRLLPPLALGLLLLLSAGAPASAATVVERYVAALRGAAAGDAQGAIEALAVLAEERPDAVPIHRALAELAIATGAEKEWRSRFYRRVRHNARDVGASVGLALLEEARGREARAHRLLLTTLDAESRDPLILDPLLRTSEDVDGLLDFLRRRQAVLPTDPDFAALRVRALGRIGRVRDARAALSRALERSPDHPELLSLAADHRRAAGQGEAACEAAQVGLGFDASTTVFPEVRTMRRLRFARALSACGRTQEAGKAIGALPPASPLLDGPSLAAWRRLAEAERLVVEQEPFRALVVLSRAELAPAELRPDLQELAWSLRARSLAFLGTPRPGLRASLLGPLPEGLALAERSAGLAAYATMERPAGADLTETVARLAAALEGAGLGLRAHRAALLARSLGAAPALSTDPPDEPGLRTGEALVLARRSLAEGSAEDAVQQAALPPVDAVGAPGTLLASLRLTAARAAQRLGRAGDAALLAREGLLDVQEAERSGQPVPPELQVLAGDASRRASELAGVRFQGLIDRGDPLEEAAGDLLRHLGRAVRAWSVLEIGWSPEPASIGEALDDASCGLVVTSEPDAAVLAIGPGTTLAAPPRRAALESGPCAGAELIFWLGPAPPPSGLGLEGAPDAVVVRAVGPGPIPEPRPAPGRDDEAGPWQPPLGGGPARTLAGLVRDAAEPPAGRGLGRGAADAPKKPVEPSAARAYLGTGVTLSRAPLASGWLVPPAAASGRGWVGPETILGWPARPESGLVAVGLRQLDGGTGLEKGSWALAEAALASGRRWALLALRPLDEEEWQALEPTLGRWERSPIDAARRLDEASPEIAAALALWSAPGRVDAAGGRLSLGTIVLAALLVGGIAGWLFRSRLLRVLRARGRPGRQR